MYLWFMLLFCTAVSIMHVIINLLAPWLHSETMKLVVMIRLLFWAKQLSIANQCPSIFFLTGTGHFLKLKMHFSLHRAMVFHSVLNVFSTQAFPYSPDSYLTLVGVTGLGVHHSQFYTTAVVPGTFSYHLSNLYFIAHRLCVPDRPLLRTITLGLVPSGPPSINIC